MRGASRSAQLGCQIFVCQEAPEISTNLGLVYGAFFGFRVLHDPELYTRFGQVKDRCVRIRQVPSQRSSSPKPSNRMIWNALYATGIEMVFS